MRRFLVLTLIAALVYPAIADTVSLNDGSKIVGRITIQSPKEIWIIPQDSDKALRIPMSDVASISVDDEVDEGEDEPPGPPREFAERAHKECRSCGGAGCEVCPHCHGPWKRTSFIAECESCDGAGTVKCPACHGKGQVHCGRCRGKGTVREKTGTRRNGPVYMDVYSDVDCPDCAGGKKVCPACQSNESGAAGGRPGGVGGGRVGGAGGVGGGRIGSTKPCLVKCQKCDGTGKRERHGNCPHCERGYAPCESCAALRKRDFQTDQLRTVLQEAQAPELTHYFDAFNRASVERAAYIIQSTIPEYALLEPGEVPNRVAVWLNVNNMYKNSEFYRSVVTNAPRLDQFFTSAQSGVENTLQFFSPRLPLDIATYDEVRVFILKGVIADFKLNLLQLRSPEQRARKIIDVLISPLLLQIDPAFHESEFAYYGVVICYGSENFLSDDGTTHKSEAVALLVRADQCHAFARGDISMDKLLLSAKCYIADRNTGLAGGMVKIDL